MLYRIILMLERPYRLLAIFAARLWAWVLATSSYNWQIVEFLPRQNEEEPIRMVAVSWHSSRLFVIPRNHQSFYLISDLTSGAVVHLKFHHSDSNTDPTAKETYLDFETHYQDNTQNFTPPLHPLARVCQ